MLTRWIISFPFENDMIFKITALWPIISPKLPWMLRNTLMLRVTESGPRISPRCLLIIGVSLFVTKPLRQESQLSNRYLGSIESNSLCSLQRIDIRTIECRYLELTVDTKHGRFSFRKTFTFRTCHIFTRGCQAILCKRLKSQSVMWFFNEPLLVWFWKYFLPT